MNLSSMCGAQKARGNRTRRQNTAFILVWNVMPTNVWTAFTLVWNVMPTNVWTAFTLVWNVMPTNVWTAFTLVWNVMPTNVWTAFTLVWNVMRTYIWSVFTLVWNVMPTNVWTALILVWNVMPTIVWTACVNGFPNMALNWTINVQYKATWIFCTKKSCCFGLVCKTNLFSTTFIVFHIVCFVKKYLVHIYMKND